jgi:hypothetical protein
VPECIFANRTHHLVKTFWGWHDKQLPDGTLILTSPAGQTYVTTPASALLFPSLCHTVGGIPAPETDTPPPQPCTNRTAMMPKRRRTRAHRITTERKQNHQTRIAEQAAANLPDDNHPPPF